MDLQFSLKVSCYQHLTLHFKILTLKTGMLETFIRFFSVWKHLQSLSILIVAFENLREQDLLQDCLKIKDGKHW